MNNKYYMGVVMHLLTQFNGFKNIVESTCPTLDINFKPCSYADDMVNKAYLSTEIVIDILESSLCQYGNHCCDKYNCIEFAYSRCYGASP